jgi:hypothetical protein
MAVCTDGRSSKLSDHTAPRSRCRSQTGRISRGCPASLRVISCRDCFIGCDAPTINASTRVNPDRRNIVGGDGREWTVRELESREAGSASKSLVFERPEVVRRVRDYPRDWATLSDDQLYRLSFRV